MNNKHLDINTLPDQISIEFDDNIENLGLTYNISHDLLLLKNHRLSQYVYTLNSFKTNSPRHKELKLFKDFILHVQYIKDYESYKNLFYLQNKAYGKFFNTSMDGEVKNYLKEIKHHTVQHMNRDSTVRKVAEHFNIFPQHARACLNRLKENLISKKEAKNDNK